MSITTTDPATGKQVVVYYMVPSSLAASDPAYCRSLLAQAVANAARTAQGRAGGC